MPVAQFPDPRTAYPDGLLAVGGDLHPETLMLAYSQGIFPWPREEWPLAWFSPEERGVLDFADLHIPRSLRKARERASFRYSIDEAFPEVIAACAAAQRPDQPGTWIIPEMVEAYIEFHELGHAHSVEVWEGDELVGGLYGVDAGGSFGGESMFHRRPNASKLAILHLIDHLRERGAEWIDIQTMTPHFELLGAKLILREEFLARLAAVQARELKLF
jgi:leucyl/phenylalanyl-tRNA---protein transferase